MLHKTPAGTCSLLRLQGVSGNASQLHTTVWVILLQQFVADTQGQKHCFTDNQGGAVHSCCAFFNRSTAHQVALAGKRRESTVTNQTVNCWQQLARPSGLCFRANICEFASVSACQRVTQHDANADTPTHAGKLLRSTRPCFGSSSSTCCCRQCSHSSTLRATAPLPHSTQYLSTPWEEHAKLRAPPPQPTTNGTTTCSATQEKAGTFCSPIRHGHKTTCTLILSLCAPPLSGTRGPYSAIQPTLECQLMAVGLTHSLLSLLQPKQCQSQPARQQPPHSTKTKQHCQGSATLSCSS